MNIWLVVGVILLIICVFLFIWYRRDWNRAVAKIKSEGQIIQTALGPIECAISGSGPAVLSVHGWGGGGSGGYNIFRFIADHRFTFNSVSRPGYLGTPLSVGETMEAQADSFVALLDTLKIDKAAVICDSGGAPASLHFALRHPERCWGLVLVSAMSHPDAVTKTSTLQNILERLFEFDFFIWIITKFFARGLIESGMGNLNAEIRQNAEKMYALRSLIDGLITGSLCRDGMRNDMQQWRQNMTDYPFTEIKVPTFIIHSRNDKSIPYTIAERTTTIPDSKMLTFDDGGHTCFVAYSEVTQPATIEFLNTHRPV